MTDTTAENDVKALKEEVKKLRQDVAAVSESLKKILRAGADAGGSQAHEELERLYDEFKETYDSVRREGGRVKTGIEKEVEERPFTALVGAFIVGMILGKFMAAR